MKNDRELHKAVLAVMLGKQVDEAKKPLHPNQQKLDVHEPEKDELTAKDFEMLRAGKKAKQMKEEEQVDEARFKKGEDVGKPGMNFAKIAKAAGKKYGSKEAGQRVAGAVLKKVLAKEEYTEEELALIEAAIEEGFDDLLKAAKERNQPQPLGGAGMKAGRAYGGSKQKDEKPVKPMKEEAERTFGEYLQAAKAKYGEEEAVKYANDAFNAKDTSIFNQSETPEA